MRVRKRGVVDTRLQKSDMRVRGWRRGAATSPPPGRRPEARGWHHEYLPAVVTRSGRTRRIQSARKPSPPAARAPTQPFVPFVPSWWKIADLTKDTLPIREPPLGQAITNRNPAIFHHEGTKITKKRVALQHQRTRSGLWRNTTAPNSQRDNRKPQRHQPAREKVLPSPCGRGLRGGVLTQYSCVNPLPPAPCRKGWGRSFSRAVVYACGSPSRSSRQPSETRPRWQCNRVTGVTSVG